MIVRNAMMQGGSVRKVAKYEVIYNAMTIKPNYFDTKNQNEMVKSLVDAGIWAKMDYLAMFADHAGNLINWANPGTHNPTKIGNPYFEKYTGYRGSIGNLINTNFKPALDGTLISQDNICLITGIGTDALENTYDVAAMSASNGVDKLGILTQQTDGNTYYASNVTNVTVIANNDAIKHYTLSRGSSSSYDCYFNKTKTTVASNSTGLTSLDLHCCGSLIGSTTKGNNKFLRYLAIFSYLTSTEIELFLDIIEEYLTEYGTNLINYQNKIAKSYRTSKVTIPLETYDGANETVHPSVVNCGKLWNGYKYYLADTPFANNNLDIENPSIWGSNDGLNFVVPAGVTNPIVPGTRNPDPELYFDAEADIMYCFWQQNGTTDIYETHSSDCINWSTPKSVLTKVPGTVNVASPCVVKVDGIFYMYYNSLGATNMDHRLRRARCNTIDGIYTDSELLNVPTNDYDKNWWHPGVVYHNGNFYMSSNSSTGALGFKVYIMKSADGINFQKSPYSTMDVDSNPINTGGYYRTCMCNVEGQWMLYYGTKDVANKWRTCRMNIDLL